MPTATFQRDNVPAQITPGDSDTNSNVPPILSRLQGWDGINSRWRRLYIGQQTAANSLGIVLPTAQDIVAYGGATLGATHPGHALAVGGYDGTNLQALRATTGGVLHVQPSFGYPSIPWSAAAFSSFATTGVLLKSGAGVFRFTQFINNTGGAVFLMLFDRTTTPSGGAVPVAVSTSTASGTLGNLNTFEGGLPCATGVYLVFSSTFTTYTAIVSTAATGVYVFA